MINFQAKTNLERQRQFRQRNPGYYGRLHRRRKAQSLVPVMAVVESPIQVQVKVVQPVKQQLALPAPVEVLEFAGLKMMIESRECVRVERGR